MKIVVFFFLFSLGFSSISEKDLKGAVVASANRLVLLSHKERLQKVLQFVTKTDLNFYGYLQALDQLIFSLKEIEMNEAIDLGKMFHDDPEAVVLAVFLEAAKNDVLSKQCLKKKKLNWKRRLRSLLTVLRVKVAWGVFAVFCIKIFASDNCFVSLKSKVSECCGHLCCLPKVEAADFSSQTEGFIADVSTQINVRLPSKRSRFVVLRPRAFKRR